MHRLVRIFLALMIGLSLGSLFSNSHSVPSASAEAEYGSLCDTFGPLHQYLYATGPSPDWQAAVICRESGWDVGATNPSSAAAGLAQFLWSTWYWAEGFCGIYGSPYNGYTAIDMMNCLLRDGQYYHWYCGGQAGCQDFYIPRQALL